MSKRPGLGDSELDNYERPLVDDLFALMEDVLALRRKLVFRSQTVSLGKRADGQIVPLAEPAVIYQNLAGDEPITAAEYERTRSEREKELRVLERAMVPLAEAAKDRARGLFMLFRTDVPPDGSYNPLAPGAFAANRGGVSEDNDDCWERLVTWGERCRDATCDRDRDVAAGVCHNVLLVLQEKYGAYNGAVPSAEQLKVAFTPATDTARSRGPNSIAAAIAGLVDKCSKDKILDAVKRSHERHNTVYEFDEKGQIASSRVLDPKHWIGWTVQEERMRIEYRPMRIRSWDGAPEPPVPEDWEDDSRGNAELLRHRRENYRWEGPTSKLVRIARPSEPERG
jgi:hypothetical protein